MAKNNQGQHRNPGLGNTAMADKLSQFRPFVAQHKGVSLRKITDMLGDGEDHINVYLDCKTKLGMELSPFTIKPFVHPYFGSFRCRQGLYYFLLSVDGDEVFRNIWPNKMRAYAYANANMDDSYPNLRFHLATSLWLQIKDDQHVLKLVEENELPYDAYFYQNKRIGDQVYSTPCRPIDVANWNIRTCDIISKAVAEGVEPDFSEFIDNNAELEKHKTRISRIASTISEAPVAAPKKKKKKKKKVTPLVDVGSTASEEQSVIPSKVDETTELFHITGVPSIVAIDDVVLTNLVPVSTCGVDRDSTSEISHIDVGTFGSETTVVTSSLIELVAKFGIPNLEEEKGSQPSCVEVEQKPTES